MTTTKQTVDHEARMRWIRVAARAVEYQHEALRAEEAKQKRKALLLKALDGLVKMSPDDAVERGAELLLEYIGDEDITIIHNAAMVDHYEAILDGEYAKLDLREID